jgi:hypothetical protein
VSPSQQHYHNALELMLSNSLTRVLLWRFIVEDCQVFMESFPMNASAYCLLAKQEIGKRLLADAKAVSVEMVHLAEREYAALMELNEQHKQQGDE